MLGRNLILVALTLGAPPAFAQQSQSQHSQPSAAAANSVPAISAVAYGRIGPGAGFDTQTNEDTELDQEALDRVNRGLAQHGYQVRSGAPYIMVIEADLVRGERQDDPLGQAFASNDGAKIEGRLFSTTQNSILNPQRPIGSADRLYRINLSVYERSSGLYVWRATANRNDPNLDVGQASAEMIAALLAHIGETVKAPAP